MNLRDLSGGPVVDAGLRWTIVFIFAVFGVAKFAAYEAAGVAMIAGKHPLFGWMYPLLGERGVSGLIGAIELVTGVVIALGAWSARASLVGGAMGVFTFLTTLSFSFGAPAFWQKGYGAPFLGSTGQFLVKDAVLLAVCSAIAAGGWRQLRRDPLLEEATGEKEGVLPGAPSHRRVRAGSSRCCGFHRRPD